MQETILASKGWGVIRITSSAGIPVLADLEKMDHVRYNTQEELRENGIFDELHATLLLPESYTVQRLVRNVLLSVWDVFVESADIPAPTYEQFLQFLSHGQLQYPVVVPTYRRDEDGTNSLVKIDIIK